MTAKEIMVTAETIVNGDRQADYGHPRDNHGCTADLWTAYLNRKLGIEIIIDAHDVCMLNILQKISRDAHKRKDDTLVDIVGYGLNAAMVGE